MNELNAFINQVLDFVNEGVLTPEEGKSLVATAEEISYQILIRYPE